MNQKYVTISKRTDKFLLKKQYSRVGWRLSRGDGVEYHTKAKQENAHYDGIFCCAWGKNRSNVNYIVSGSLDNQVKTWKWNIDHLESERSLQGHHLGVISVDINRSGTLAASSSLDSQIRVWDLQEGIQYRYIDAGPVDAWTIAFSPDSRLLASGGQTGDLNLFNIDTSKKEVNVPLNGKFSYSIAYSPDCTHVAAGSVDGFINIVDVNTKRVFKNHCHDKTIRSLSFSQDGTLLASCADDGLVKVFDVRHGSPVCTLFGHASLVLAVDFNLVNSDLIASGSSDKTVRLWDMRNKQALHVYHEHEEQVWDVRFSPDGTKLCSVSDDRSLIVYNCSQ